MSTRAILVVALAAGSTGTAAADSPPLRPGSYAVDYRLEVPHVEEWAIDQTATICVPAAGAALPVLSGNNPLARCPARNINVSGARLSFDIVCGGRAAAVAEAVYMLGPDTFHGRIAMTMGGKNMTFVEVQSGSRIGDCALTEAALD